MMKKSLLMLTAVLSFSLAASANATVRTESIANKPAVQVKKSPRTTAKTEVLAEQPVNQKKQSAGIRVERRQEQKVERNITKTDKQRAPLATRKDSLEQSKNSHLFTIYDAWTELNYDFDGDGYFSEFTVNFDADFSGGYADVFADLYLSRDGGPWVHFATTDVFTIYSSDSDDDYSVTTLLNYGFPTGNYDVLIDLFEYGYAGVVDTVGPNTFDSLALLPLEDDEHELNSNDTLITYVASEIAEDLDADGFYTSLTLEYDIDTTKAGALVYAEIQLTNVDTFAQATTSTEDFILGNQTEIVELILEAGYQAGWYDVEIRLLDSYTGQVLANAAQDFSSLVQLPIESEDFDDRVDTPRTNNGHVDTGGAVVTQESGGSGTMFWLVIAGLLTIGVRRFLL